MKIFIALTVTALLATAANSSDFKLPKEVTPQLRAACETDVRRLCIGQSPTVAKVKSCVRRNFTKLGMRCQLTLAAAGFSK